MLPLSDISNVVWPIDWSLFQDIATREQLLFLISLFFYCYCTVTKIPWSENATSNSSAVVWLQYRNFLNNAQNKTRIIQTQRCHLGGLIWWGFFNLLHFINTFSTMEACNSVWWASYACAEPNDFKRRGLGGKHPQRPLMLTAGWEYLAQLRTRTKVLTLCFLPHTEG